MLNSFAHRLARALLQEGHALFPYLAATLHPPHHDFEATPSHMLSSCFQSLRAHGTYLHAGDRIRLRPRPHTSMLGRSLNCALNGELATITAFERDAAGHLHVAVIVDATPTRQAEANVRLPRRLFFGIEEIEPLRKAPHPAR